MTDECRKAFEELWGDPSATKCSKEDAFSFFQSAWSARDTSDSKNALKKHASIVAETYRWSWGAGVAYGLGRVTRVGIPVDKAREEEVFKRLVKNRAEELSRKLEMNDETA